MLTQGGSDLIHQLKLVALDADNLPPVIHTNHQFAAAGVGKCHQRLSKLIPLGQLALEFQGFAFAALDFLPEKAIKAHTPTPPNSS